MDLRNYDPGFRRETCHTSSGDGNQVEEVTIIKEEESPEAISFPDIKTEHEVSCMPVCPLFCTSYRY